MGDKNVTTVVCGGGGGGGSGGGGGGGGGAAQQAFGQSTAGAKETMDDDGVVRVGGRKTINFAAGPSSGLL
jgi:hypothetical protein